MHSNKAQAEANLITATTAILSDSDSDLFYASISSSMSASRNYYFERLAFKSEDESEYLRNAFIDNVHNHVQHKSHGFLQRHANPEAFKIVIIELLAEYGPVYQGYSERIILRSQTYQKYFFVSTALYEKVWSKYIVLFLITLIFIDRFIFVLKGFFSYRAYNTRKHDVSSSELDYPRENWHDSH